MTEELNQFLATALRGHAGEIARTGGERGRGLLHALVGIVIGAIAAFHTESPTGLLSKALEERLRRLPDAFRRVVFAQVRISLLSTVATATYLLVAFPLSGVELPLRKTLVILTFVFGLIPVLGNLLSNTVIVVVLLGVSFTVASLVYLVVIHKLEYFLDARIVGHSIHSADWEILVAMLLFEAVSACPASSPRRSSTPSDRQLLCAELATLKEEPFRTPLVPKGSCPRSLLPFPPLIRRDPAY